MSGQAPARTESELITMDSKLETQFVLRWVTNKESASWKLLADPENGIVWEIAIPFPGSGGVPWIVQTFPLSQRMAREIAEWLLARLQEDAPPH